MIRDFLLVLPLIITIYISVAKKDVILALYTGVFFGVLILASGNIVKTFHMFLSDYLLVELTDSYNAGVIILIVFISGFIALMEYSNGASAFAKKITFLLNTKVKTQLCAYFFGVLIFFSDLGTPLIVGPVFSPIFDKMKICRAKLAYISDSTASPMAILIPFTGWGIYIMSLIDEQINNGVIVGNSSNIFIHAIGFQFYSILTLIVIPIVIIFKLDIFSMKKAQEEVDKRENNPILEVHPQQLEDIRNDKEGKAHFIIVPLLILFIILTFGLLKMGFPFVPLDGAEFRVVLSSAYFVSAVSIILLMMINGHKFMELYKEYIYGMKKATTMIFILIGAWSLSAVIEALGTTDLIINLLNGNIPNFLYPALIFITGTLLSSTTGSSWGTLAILTPFALGVVSISGIDSSILMGAVLSGSLFGDHLSPISDTTIFSASGAGINLLDHVYTQLPYGIINACASLICFIGLGIYPSYIWLVVAIVLAVGTLFGLNLINSKNFKILK